MNKGKTSRVPKTPKSMREIPDREVVTVRMFRLLMPAFIFMFLAAGVIFYAQSQISKQILFSPSEGDTFLDVPLSYWYWIIGLAILLILLLVGLIIVVLMINSRQAAQANSLVREQAKKVILDAQKSGYSKPQIISKFREKGWSDSEISEVLDSNPIN